MPVKSPYNFVPAPEESLVIRPEWASQVSHDVPFSDGESGELELKITAETPIFIRNGRAKDEEDNEFSHVLVNGKPQYFIPGTSLKGMIRNVLEIMTNSRLNKELVGDDRYAFRDLTRDSPYMKSYKSNEVRAGWLTEKSDGQWEIHECEFAHIHHEEVDKACGTKFRHEFLNRTPKDDQKTAKYKYSKLNQEYPESTFSVSRDDGDKAQATYSKGGVHGIIVFTGQPGPRKEDAGRRPGGKVNEFVFLGKTGSPYKIEEKQQKDFKFIYLDHDNNNISPDWKYWRTKLEEGKPVPIFFTKNGEKVKHFGLAFMYKLPYEKSIHEMNPISSYKSAADFAHVMFGRASKNDALKGRVMVGNSFSTNAQPAQELVKEILASPKASYYPFYLSQHNPSSNGYNSYQKVGTLSGFKKYPVHQSVKKPTYDEKQQNNPKIFTQFRPLESGAEFTAKIRFHNLRKVEIGALLSAITFHNNAEKCFHSLGSAKPLGYGKVKVVVSDSKFLNHSTAEYMQAFEEFMESKLQNNWFRGASVQALLAMASNVHDESLTYAKVDEYKAYIGLNEHLVTPALSAHSGIQSVGAKMKADNEKRRQIEEEQKASANAARERELIEVLRTSKDDNAISAFLLEFPLTSVKAEFLARIDSIRREKKEMAAAEMQQADISFNSFKFNDIKTPLNNKLKENKLFKYSDSQRKQISEALLQCWEVDKGAFYKKKALANFNEFPWTDIRKWLGDDEAKKLYEQFTSMSKK